VMRADRLAILAEGRTGVITSKTAACVIRYQPDRVACVIDSTKRGLTSQQVLGFGGAIPIVGSLDEALAHSPDALLIGIAPRGGTLPAEWRPVVLGAIKSGMNILSGLHTMLNEDPEICAEARSNRVVVWDIRQVAIPDGVARGLLRHKKGKVILTVGSDCSSGKMTAAYEVTAGLKKKGIRAEFVPTGQTGILLSGWGQALDRAPGDFMARIAEDLALEGLARADVAVVEGQGSLIHPAYSSVTLALIHGCRPDLMVMCHQPTRTQIEDFDLDIPPIPDLVGIYERACSPIFESEVAAVALNTYDLEETRARQEVAEIGRQTSLPTDDPVRWGAERICQALEDHL
jgi:uncharacterized NAD-dependent epimerase/dehydratase family protein